MGMRQAAGEEWTSEGVLNGKSQVDHDGFPSRYQGARMLVRE